MKKLVKDLFSSFNNEPSGFSARKLSAFFGVVIVSGYITFKHSGPSNVVDLVLIWLSFAMLCLGLITVGQLIELRTGITTKKETKTTVETKSESTQNTDP